jgi:predicted dehydrogenase
VTSTASALAAEPRADTRLRLGFVGVGWIGRNRMQAILSQDICDVAGIVEPNAELARRACAMASTPIEICSFEKLLASKPDGIVIATPSAMHAEQSVAALERGISVFCQKPLGRTLAETSRVVDAARQADRLLCVDFSYRFVRGVQQIRELVKSGELGDIYRADCVFHNAYGPDKAWFYDPVLSGGGCLIDLGIHLVDLVLWILDWPMVLKVSAQLFSEGTRLTGRTRRIEDYAAASLELASGAVAQLACSWKAHAGTDAVIDFAFYGTKGGARLRNVNGSFFDFVAERFRSTSAQTLSEPPESWGGRAAVAWLGRLSRSNRYTPDASEFANVAAVLDRIYQS